MAKYKRVADSKALILFIFLYVFINHLLANPIDRKGQGFAENVNGGFLVGPNAMVQEIPIQSKFELANKLLDELLEFKSKLF